MRTGSRIHTALSSNALRGTTAWMRVTRTGFEAAAAALLRKSEKHSMSSAKHGNWKTRCFRQLVFTMQKAHPAEHWIEYRL